MYLTILKNYKYLQDISQLDIFCKNSHKVVVYRKWNVKGKKDEKSRQVFCQWPSFVIKERDKKLPKGKEKHF